MLASKKKGIASAVGDDETPTGKITVHLPREHSCSKYRDMWKPTYY